MLAEGLVDWDESVAGMNEASIDNARRAVVPVWAIEALVAYTVDELR